MLYCYYTILNHTIYTPYTLYTTLQYRYIILPKDFDEAYSKKVKKTDKEFTFYTT